MPKLVVQQPRYCRHRNRAVVYLCGKDIYLGAYGSDESKEAYRRLMSWWNANWQQLGAAPPALSQIFAPPNSQPEAQTSNSPNMPSEPLVPPTALTVVELISRYRAYAKTYYVKNGKVTSEVNCINGAMKFLRRKFGRLPAGEFSPKKLEVVRDAMITGKLARTTINQNVKRIRRMFRWAASQELVAGSIVHDLGSLPGLKEGRSKAKEAEPIGPVDSKVVDATLPFLPAIVADMVRVQQFSGMRPQEVCMLRPKDIERSADVWHFTPTSHKTEHFSKTRVVAIGPRAQEILKRYLLRDETAYCFSPAESEKNRRRQAHDARKTPLKYGNRPGTNRRRKPKRKAGVQYSTAAYRRAITRAVDLANEERAKKKETVLPQWAPNQLRHSLATTVRADDGIDAAACVLGHSNPNTTLIYAERDLARADAIMKEIG